LVAATAPLALFAGDATATVADGTPEQIHLTWGDDPSSTVQVSWASPAQALNPRVSVRHADRSAANPARHDRVIHAVQRTYTDGINGQTVFTYHAQLDALEPGAIVEYAVTADNDRNRARPFAGPAMVICRRR
jgi:hypothetical protein